MREHALAALRVIDGPARQISANRDANHQRAGESIIRAPADHAQLIANLHHRRPDVIEELNLDHWLQPTRGHTGGAPHDGGLSKRSVEHPVIAKLALQAERQLEDSALTLDQLALQIFFAAAVGNVFAKDHD